MKCPLCSFADPSSSAEEYVGFYEVLASNPTLHLPKNLYICENGHIFTPDGDVYVKLPLK